MTRRHMGWTWCWVAVVLSGVVRPAGAAGAAVDLRPHSFNSPTHGGGARTGPDLKGVTELRDRAWLLRWMQNPQAVVDSGDPVAKELVAKYRGVVMPTVSGMTADRAGALLDLIAAESGLPESAFVGLQVTDKPFTPADVAKGRNRFLGRTKLTNGGPACVSCHTVQGVPGLGGGRLGPELTRVYERIQGRKALAAWLLSPPTPTMKPLFSARALSPDEILSLVAFIEAGAALGGQAPLTGRINVLLLGLAGLAALLFGFDTIWKGRHRSVRRALVESATRKGGLAS